MACTFAAALPDVRREVEFGPREDSRMWDWCCRPEFSITEPSTMPTGMARVRTKLRTDDMTAVSDWGRPDWIAISRIWKLGPMPIPVRSW